MEGSCCMSNQVLGLKACSAMHAWSRSKWLSEASCAGTLKQCLTQLSAGKVCRQTRSHGQCIIQTLMKGFLKQCIAAGQSEQAADTKAGVVPDPLPSNLSQRLVKCSICERLGHLSAEWLDRCCRCFKLQRVPPQRSPQDPAGQHSTPLRKAIRPHWSRPYKDAKSGIDHSQTGATMLSLVMYDRHGSALHA